VQLAVIALVEEMPAAAFLPAQRVVIVQGEEQPRADAAHTDQGLKTAVGDVYE
jgi:hypothetical protein